ncbi:universal stress protein [Phenylobacterium sp.]|uniref:universal stress protein n=1 Tax=Phenylobacterium sp. TaxID=1871053 RepID=UPI0035634920
MYQRVLLAYDGTADGALALREGALLAKQCCAQIILLAVVPESAGTRLADGVYAGAVAQQIDTYKELLAGAVAWLEARGYRPVAKLVVGEPAPVIGAVAEEVAADLVVVAHHRQGFLSRWWSGSTDSYLSDHLGCTLLIARNPLTEEAFDAAAQVAAAPPQQASSPA